MVVLGGELHSAGAIRETACDTGLLWSVLMADGVHPLAPHHLPGFITPPGETDTLLVVTGIILLLAVLGVGLIFLRLHTLPERMAHKSQKLQFEIVAVLGLLALFTHVHLFWVAGLLLALIDLPDFTGLFGRMAHALERIAGVRPPASETGIGEVSPADTSHAASESHAPARKESGHA